MWSSLVSQEKSKSKKGHMSNSWIKGVWVSQIKQFLDFKVACVVKMKLFFYGLILL